MEETEVKEINIKSISNEKIVFEYDNFKRILIILAYVFGIFLGLVLILIDNWFVKVVGILFVIFGLISVIDMSLFKALIFKDDRIVKEWHYLGSKKINFEDLEVDIVKRLWSGIIYFKDRNKGSLTRLLMQFEMFPIGNDKFQEIREILINKKIIKGDENGWEY